VQILDFVVTAFAICTPLIYAVIGETIAQRAGVINLGIEGQMLMGAFAGYAAAFHFGNPWVGLVIGACAGLAMSALFAVTVLWAGVNQITSGLAVFLLGSGLSAFYGRPFVGSNAPTFADLGLVKEFNATNVLAIAILVAIVYIFYRTPLGIVVKAVGASADSTYLAGFSPTRVRYAAVLAGGILSGLGGAALSLGYANSWTEGMTHGMGWIAVALVVVAAWEPLYVLPAVLIYGFASLVALIMQTRGIPISPYLLQTIPYVVALGVMAFFASSKQNAVPRELKKVFAELDF
jgi:simple sugar transport system permease protein